jgi:hypothetical protein
MKSKSAQSIQFSFLNYVLIPFTTCYALRSDRESGIIKSAEFQQFAAQLGITLLPTAPSSPATNGQAENRIRQVKTLLKIMYSIHHSNNWDKQLHLIQIAMNKTPTCYGYTSEEIFFGTAVPSKLDLLRISEPPRSLDDFMAVVQAHIQIIREKVHIMREKNRLQNEKWANAKRVRRTFEEGDIVKYQHRVIKANSAIQAPFKGPYMVKRLSDHQHTCIIQNMTTGAYSKAHYNQLLPYTALQTPTQLNSDWDKELKQLIERRNTRSNLMRPPVDNSEENAENDDED